MPNLILNPTALAQWHTLLNEAQAHCALQINEEIESYVIFMLMRHINDAHLANRTLAVDYLTAIQENVNSQQTQLREVGDNCLIIAGLFPQRAEKKLVRISYFVNIGQGAYHMLAERSNTFATLFDDLAAQFVQLMDILQAMRQVAREIPILSPLQAAELWEDTGSKQAFSQLKQYTSNIPVTSEDDQKRTKH